MKITGIVTDSHSGITQQEAAEWGIKVLPMPFYIEGECYYEDVTLSRDKFFETLASGVTVTTSQPSPDAVMKLWNEALQEYEEIVYIPISSGLSGSCATATAFAQEDKYNGRVFVVDNGRVSTPLRRSIMDAMELIEEGYSAQQIKTCLESAKDNMNIYIAVENLESLRRGGRISATSAVVGTMLNIKPVLQFTTGMLEPYKKCRGFKTARKMMIEAMHQDIEIRFKEWYDRGEICLMAASSASPEVTAGWIKEIEEAFPGMRVLCDNLSLGVSSHTGSGALGIGCSCRPARPE